MAYQNNRGYATQMRNTMGSNIPGIASSSAGQSPALLARINEKRAELDNLRQLRDLSAGLAQEMQTLESKLATLSDGTEVKIPKPKDEEEDEQQQALKRATGANVPLPQTLVRIPTQQHTTQPGAQEPVEE
ncbi:hypothetical protein L228DRAFT_266009 [Xylona heveae TC161]|uniref:DASH complex subunit DAD2 n=1 Tax=Xylona heveae (strain CBS 132557 / TC161) TaxID=1328760 RepID=A0A165IYA9_XYLHT|nr:hypothetical protein L228DRAFT_266009 [Xylona heveae TC161]KZF25543.1 hypothetical protein L228DRAFT_266009 [Xylona heveae TC161]